MTNVTENVTETCNGPIQKMILAEVLYNWHSYCLLLLIGTEKGSEIRDSTPLSSCCVFGILIEGTMPDLEIKVLYY